MLRVTFVSAVVSAIVLLGPSGGADAATSTSLLLPQSTAFAVLGHSCGGIQEQAFATGFDAVSGYPVGDVYLQTRCDGSGRGGGYHTTTYSAWVAVTWDFSAAVRSYAKLAAAPTGLDPAFSATDANGDRVYNLLNHAYLSVVPPGAPTGVSAAQVGDQLQVSWTPAAASAAVITSSTVTATPVGGTAPVLTVTVSGTATSALVGPAQPATTYQVTVVSTDAGGSSPPSDPATISTPASSVAPSAPTGVSEHWTAPGTQGDQLVASWAAAVPGDSPIDEYEVTASVRDGDPPFPAPVDQAVSGSTLTAAFLVDDTFDWAIQVRAHNAAGWGPWSTPVVLGGA
jgi:hypothetical protein